jgi:hypothetical protein
LSRSSRPGRSSPTTQKPPDRPFRDAVRTAPQGAVPRSGAPYVAPSPACADAPPLYVSDILPGLLTVSIGLGGVFTGLTTAANAGVGEDQAGLAAGLLNTGQQLGAALGLAILSALATARTSSLLNGGHDTVAQAATHGYQRALLAGAVLMLAASVIALLARHTRQTTAPVVEQELALDLAA